MDLTSYQLTDYFLGPGQLRNRGFSTGWRRLSFSIVEFSPDGIWNLEQETGKTLRFLPGEVLFVPAGQKHCLSVERSIEAMTTYWLGFNVKTNYGLDMFWGASRDPSLGPRESQLCRQLVRDICDITDQGMNMVNSARIKRSLWSIIELALTGCEVLSGLDGLQTKRIAAVLAYVQHNLDRNITRDDMARKAGLSPARFHDVFKEAVGVAPLHFVIQCRLRRAQELLVNTDASVAEVGERSGFQSTHYFSRLFRKHVGKSPAEFRKIMRIAGASPNPS